MGIKKLSDGNFKVQYQKRHPVTKLPVMRSRLTDPVTREPIKTMAHAKRIEAMLVVEVNDILKRQIVPTWEQHLNDYFASIQVSGLTGTTIYNREKTLRHHTHEAWNNKLIDEISNEEIYKLLQVRFADKSEAHKKFFIKCIKGVFQFALEKGLISRNPTPLLKFKISDKIKAVLNEEQITTLLQKAQELDWQWYPHYAVALYTGMRNGELYALTWKNVNLEARQIVVNCSWNSKSGYKSTKSGDDRVIEIPKPLIPLLMELKLESAHSEFVLPRLSKWDKGEQARDLRCFLKSIGLPEIRFHDLRASWATLLLNKGVAPSKVMSMGGWKDMDTMMIYMRKAGIPIKGATSVLDDMQTHGIQTGKVVKFRPS